MAQATKPEPPQLVADRFQVLALLGGGEITETYKVADTVTKRILALKTLRGDAPKAAVARLNREFYCLSRFTHPGIVTAVDYGVTAEGRPFFTMEYVEGKAINIFFAKGFRPELKVVAVQMLEALDRVHAQDMIHCDLKPQNILVACEDGSPRAKLIDFGFAGQPAMSDADAARGTLGYVAPEVLKGMDADARADLYSLGLVLYEVITGQGPGRDKDLRKWLRMQYLSDFKPPREFDENIPEDFASLVMSLVQREPERRPHSAAAVIGQLTRTRSEPTAAAAPPEYPVAPGFVGRSDELAGLKELLDNASEGRAGLACVTGERGVGKSRLLSEFKFVAQLEGATILSFERASLGARRQSLVEMILGYLNTYSAVDLPSSDDSREATTDEKFRLFETVLNGLRELSASSRVQHSLVLLVDDIELYDSNSLAFLRYLAFALSSERLTVLVAGLNEARFLALIAEFGRTGCFQHIQLPPLGQKEVETLVASLVGEMPGREVLTEWLMRTTGGSPLFVIEAIRALMEGGILSRGGNRWVLVQDALNAYRTPDSVAEVLRRRLETLSEEEIAVLEVGATTAGPLTLEFLRATLGPDGQVLPGVVTKLRSLGLLRSLVIDGEASFVLSSKMLEAALIERMAASARRENHRRVALALERLYPEKTDQLLFDLAHHYAQAGVEDRAFSYSLRAGTRAREHRLSEQALGYYETALALSERAGSARERVELHERVGELREATGRYPEAIDAYTQGTAIIAADAELAQDKSLLVRFRRKVGQVHQKQGHHYEALDSFNQALLLQPDRDASAYVDTLNDMGWSYYALGGYKRADQLLSAALRLAKKMKNLAPAVYSRLSARSYYHLSVLAWSRGDLVLAQQLVERSIENCEAAQDEHSASEASQFLATLWWSRGDTAQAREQYQRYLPAQRRSGEVYFLLRSLQGLGIINQAECHWDKAYNCFAEALNLAERIGDNTAIADLNSNLGTMSEERGDWDQALAAYRRAIELRQGAQTDDPYGRNVVMANLAQLLTRQGETAEAERLLQEIQAFVSQNPTPDLEFVLGDCRIQLLLRTGRLEPAGNTVAQTLRSVRRDGDPRKLARLFTLASELRLTQGHFMRAAEDARRALVRLGDQASSSEYAVALRFSGLAKCMLDRTDRGIQEIRRSIELLRETGVRHELALSLMSSAQALTTYGRQEATLDLKLPLSFRPVAEQDVDEALANLKEAHAILRSIGARPDAQRADELMETVNHVSATLRLKARGREEYLEVFYEISKLIGLGLEKEDFLERILDLVIDVIKAERGILFLVQRGKLVPAAGRNIDHTTLADATAISRSVLRKVKRGETVFSADALTDPRFNSANSVMLNKIRSLLCVPLTVEKRVVGTIYVDSRVTAHLFLEEDTNLLASVANLLAATIDKSAAFRKLQEEMSVLREDMLVDAATGYFMGRSKAMKDVYRVIDRIAPSNCTVLLTGETGTGKGVLARLLHAKSERRAHEFMSINCGALPENLFESELFGHARGAFTGAVRDKDGLFEAAAGGTVFLDEVSNTTLGVQAKLLQVLDEKVVRRVGETQPRRVDVRLICATNRDLRQEVRAGHFREDLFYRVNGVTINVPALRERAADIGLLADYFVKRYAGQLNKPIDRCEERVLEVFSSYTWPGNVRELQNVIERAVIMAQGNRIAIDDLGAQFAGIERMTEVPRGKRERFERREVVNALRVTGGNVSKAAELLSVHRRQFQRLMQRFGIDRTNPI